MALTPALWLPQAAWLPYEGGLRRFEPRAHSAGVTAAGYREKEAKPIQRSRANSRMRPSEIQTVMRERSATVARLTDSARRICSAILISAIHDVCLMLTEGRSDTIVSL